VACSLFIQHRLRYRSLNCKPDIGAPRNKSNELREWYINCGDWSAQRVNAVKLTNKKTTKQPNNQKNKKTIIQVHFFVNLKDPRRPK
jgi:hypothetical protein